MPSIGEKLKAHWSSMDLKINRGIPESELQLFERRYDVSLPDDFRSYFLSVNGMDANVCDESLIRFWPLQEVTPLPDEAPHLVGLGTIAYANSLFVFADYSIWAHAYAIQLGRESVQNSVYIIAGATPDRIAGSFSEFVDLYLSKSIQNVNGHASS